MNKAQELKEHGFPLKRFDETVYINLSSADSSIFTFETNDGLFVYPTLEELIEACGNGFISLDSPLIEGSENNWRATAWNEKYLFIKGQGQTPTEAVANLWLVLNPKQK